MLEGEVVLVLDREEATVLKAGDVVVQRGTDHRWENRTDRVARMVFILVDGAFTPELVASIGADAAASLLHDPIGDAS